MSGRRSLPIYIVCPVCGRVTSTDSGYCRHCRAPLFPFSFLETPAEAYEYDIPVGRDREGREVGFKLGDLSKHLGIFGLTGFGKTNLVKVLVEGLAEKGVGVLVFDWEGEYRDFAGIYGFRVVDVMRGIGLNVFSPAWDVDLDEYSIWLAELLASLYAELYGENLSPPMRFVLGRSLRENLERRGDFGSLLELFKKYSMELPSRSVTYSALYTRFEFLASEFMNKIFSGELIDFSENLIFDLSRVSRVSISVARFLVILLLRIIFDKASIRRGENPSKVVIIEEAEEVVGREARSANVLRFLLRARKRGLGLVIVAHSPSLVDESLLKSISNLVVFRLGDFDDSRRAASMLGLSFENSRILMSLRRGEAFVRTFSSPSPFLVRVRKYEPVGEGEELVLARRMVDSVVRFPFLSVRARRALLGLSSRQYRRVEEILVSRNILRPVYVVVGRGRPVKLYGLKGERGESVAHRYAIYYIKEKCREVFGEDIFEENNVVDLYSRRLGVCIEVETGTHVFPEKYGRIRDMCRYILVVPVTRSAVNMLRKHVLGGKDIRLVYLYEVPGLLEDIIKKNHNFNKNP